MDAMKVLVAGWFSFENGHATAGDLLARDLASQWLEEAGWAYDVANVAMFGPGVDWRSVDPDDYSHAVFVCGPYQKGELEAAFISRFAGCRLLGLNLSMDLPLQAWNPFDVLIERDSDAADNADIVFLSRQRLAPVVGVCRVEPHPEALVDVVDAAIERLLAGSEAAIIRIDTRLDVNDAGLRTPAEIEALIARVDALVTTRLHGLVLALKNGVPAIALDAVPGGGKIRRQARKIGWPLVFTLDELDDQTLRAALERCLTGDCLRMARACAERAEQLSLEVRDKFMSALERPDEWESRFRARTTPKAIEALLDELRPLLAEEDKAAAFGFRPESNASSFRQWVTGRLSRRRGSNRPLKKSEGRDSIG